MFQNDKFRRCAWRRAVAKHCFVCPHQRHNVWKTSLEQRLEHILTCILKHVLKRPVLHVTDSETPSRTSNELVFLNAFETLDCAIDSVSTYTLIISKRHAE